MDNEERAEQLVQQYGFDFGSIPKQDIITLLRQEVDRPQPGSSEYIRLLCGYLFCLGDSSDVPLLEKAKYGISMDVGCMIDGAWIDNLKNGSLDEEDEKNKLIDAFVSYYRNYF